MGSVGATTRPRTRRQQVVPDANNSNWQAFQAIADATTLTSAVSAFNAVNVDLGVNTRLQKTIQAMGLNEKPVVLDDAAFDASLRQNALDGVELYRGLTGSGSMTASDMTEYFKFGDRTLAGRGIHGDGFYFSTDQGTGRAYSDYTKNSVITGYIDKSKAKVITEKRLIAMYNKESGAIQSAFGGRTTGRDSVLAQYALYKGYNVIHVPGGNAGGHSGTTRSRNAFKNGSEDYYVPLMRSVMVVRKTSRIS